MQALGPGGLTILANFPIYMSIELCATKAVNDRHLGPFIALQEGFQLRYTLAKQFIRFDPIYAHGSSGVGHV